jgi:hypothetical protein
MQASSATEFKAFILVTSHEFGSLQARPDITMILETEGMPEEEIKWYQFGKGVKTDLLGRLPYYLDDFKVLKKIPKYCINHFSKNSIFFIKIQNIQKKI